MKDIPPLSQEQIEFLQWMNQQSDGLTMCQLSEAEAPGYTRERLVKMQKELLLIEKTLQSGRDGLLDGAYSISDYGRAVLSSLEKIQQQEAQEEAARALQQRLAEEQNTLTKKQTRLMLIQTVIAAVSFLTGVLVEHFCGLADFFLGFFR